MEKSEAGQGPGWFVSKLDMDLPIEMVVSTVQFNLQPHEQVPSTNFRVVPFSSGANLICVAWRDTHTQCIPPMKWVGL